MHSKMEVKRSNIEVHERVEKSQEASKRAFKKRNMELDSTVRAVKAKTERDGSRMETMLFVQRKPHLTLQTRHEIEKQQYLQSEEDSEGS